MIHRSQKQGFNGLFKSKIGLIIDDFVRKSGKKICDKLQLQRSLQLVENKN